MLTISVGSTLSLIDIIPKYLSKDCLVYTILIIYLEVNLSKKFNLNLDYILTKAPDLDNQNDILYKTFYQKLIDIF